MVTVTWKSKGKPLKSLFPLANGKKPWLKTILFSLKVKFRCLHPYFSCYFYVVFFSSKMSRYRLFLLHLAWFFLPVKMQVLLRPIRQKPILTKEKDRTKYNNEERKEDKRKK